MKHLYFIRHGESEFNKLDLRKMLPLSELGTDELKILLSPGSVSVDTLTGEKEFLTVRDSSGDVVVLRKSSKAHTWSGTTSDTPLTINGQNQVALAAKKAYQKGLKLDVIISSPLMRALQTAKILAAEFGYPEEKIMIDPRTAERDFGTLEGRKDLVAATKYVINEAAIDTYDGVEGISDLQKRADLFLEYLHTLPDNTILIAGHGAFGRALRRSAKKQPIHIRYKALKNAEMIKII